MYFKIEIMQSLCNDSSSNYYITLHTCTLVGQFFILEIVNINARKCCYKHSGPCNLWFRSSTWWISLKFHVNLSYLLCLMVQIISCVQEACLVE